VGDDDVMKKAKKPKLPRVSFRSDTDFEDAWQRRATAAAVAAVRQVIAEDVIPPSTPIGRLGETEWSWFIAAGLFAWIATRVAQVTTERILQGRRARHTIWFDYEPELIVRSGLDPDPRDAGIVETILPQLGGMSDIDWTLPFGSWPRETVVRFLTHANRLINAARDAAPAEQTDGVDHGNY
jgi:hypothetical protein